MGPFGAISRLCHRFCYEKRFWHVSERRGGGGGGWVGREDEVLHKNVSQILAKIDFSRKEITRKILSARQNTISNITLSQTSSLDLHKFGGDNYIPHCPDRHHSDHL